MTEQSQQQLTHNQSTLLQSTPILSTKLYIPPARENAIARPLLVERLLHGVERPGNFILISGPAGFGKTTLLSEFAGRCMQPTTWVSLDESDNDLIRFWTYLITACQSILGDVGESALELLSTAQQLPDDTIPTILINDFAMQDRSIVLVLDDYHNIQNSSIHGSLQFLLDHLPHNFHIIVSTRIDPPWPLVRYRARNQLTEIRAQDLRFSIVEAAEFLTCTMELDLSDKDIAILEERTEGWIAGLQLAALSIEGRSDVADFIRAFTGSHLFIAEYLIIEILQKQPEDRQLFLLQTSILERMNSGLCEAVTDCPDGQAILNDLHRANIFLIPLDNEGHWFRYHHLFADLLLARLRHDLSGAATAELHMRASDWYAQNGFTLEAVNHALAASDFKRAAALVDQAGQTMILTDKYSVLNNWLGALPKEAFQTYPRLEIYQVLIDLNLAKLDMSEHTLNEKERLINALPPSPENDRLRLAAMVYLSLFLAFQNSSRAIRIAKDALAEIPETDLKLRAFLFSALYRAYGMEGNRERSAPAYRECLRLAEAAGQYGMVANTTMIRAFDLCQYGRLDEATRYCQLIIDAGKRLGRKVFYPAGTAYIGLAGIHLERNDLQLAEDYLKRGLELCRQGGTFGLFTGYAQKSRLHQAKGEFDEALAQLQFIEQTFQRREFTLVARQVSIRLAMNDVASASLMVPALLEILGGSPFAYQLPLVAVESIKLSLPRIYIAQGLIEQALQALDEIEGTVERDKRFGRLMEVYLLRALAEQKEQAQNVTCKAKRYLEEALDLAEPVGFILLFLEEGPALIPLLNAVVDDRDTPNRLKKYAQKLQNAFADFGKPEVLNRPGIADGLVESLTPREMEILQLIATGDSNQEIADELVITVRTVKKHISNILGKLDANNRTQAVALAREHRLITSE